MVWRHYTHYTYRLTRIKDPALVALAALLHTATVTSLAAPAVTRPRRAATAYLAAMVAVVLAWLAAAWRWHDGRPGPEAADYLLLPPLLLLVVALVYLWRCYRRPRPVAFGVRDGAFVAPPADRLTAAMAAMLLAGGSTSAAIFLWPLSQDGPRALLVAGRVTLVVLLVAFLAQVAVFRRGTGRILLRPEGLRITYAYGGRDVPWEAMSAGPPRAATLTEPVLRIGRPELVRATGLARPGSAKAMLPASSTWIRREFLADAINYYLAVPAARESIGTAEGYEHLRRVLRAG
jgi:hypothetical protein